MHAEGTSPCRDSSPVSIGSPVQLWRDRPSGTGDLWIFDGKQQERYGWSSIQLICITVNRDACYEVAHRSTEFDDWQPTWSSYGAKLIDYGDLEGKWAKIPVPESL